MPTEQKIENETEVENQAAPGDGFEDIADLIAHAADQNSGGGEEKKEGEKTPEEKSEEKKPSSDGKSEGGEKEQKIAPVTEPDKEAEKDAAKPEQSLKDALKEVLAETRAEKKPEAETKPEAYKPRYSPVVPDQIMQAMESDDPKVRQQGISAMIGGAMNKVHDDLKKDFQAQLTQAMQSIPQVIGQLQTQQETVAQMRKTFYDENPNFGTSPARMKLVATVAMQLGQTEGEKYKGFTPEFRTKLAKTLEEMTGLKAGKVAAAPEKKPGVPKKPGFQPGSGTRDGEPSAEEALRNEIADVVGMVIN